MKNIFLATLLILFGFNNTFAQKADSVSKSPGLNVKGIKKPIYAIDGVKQTSNSDFAISKFEADSIAEIKILKDDDAILLFGQEAVNGVILVTTKSGKNSASNLEMERKLSLLPGRKSISKITNLKITKLPAKTDSLSVTDTPKIIIRGLEKGVNSFDDVVYILDGQKIDKNGMDWINPEIIQSIVILKKDSAIAKYGPQAANGVVIITTKNQKKLKVTEKPVDRN